MKLSDKLRYLREVEGSLRGLGRAMTQQELVRAIAEETDGGSVSQSYLSQIESGSRPHLTNTTRLLLARFFKVHPGYLVEDPEDFQAEFRTAELVESLAEDKLDLWLIAGAERFGRNDPKLCRALLKLAKNADTRRCLLLLEAILETPALAERLMAVLRPTAAVIGEAKPMTTAEKAKVSTSARAEGRTDEEGSEAEATLPPGVAGRKGSSGAGRTQTGARARAKAAEGRGNGKRTTTKGEVRR